MGSGREGSPHPAAPLPCRVREPLGVGALGVAAFAAVRWLHPTGRVRLPCPSLVLFGVYCPLCGGTRAAYALSTGALGAAFGYNAFVPVIVLLSGWGWLAWLTRCMGGKVRVPGIPRQGTVLVLVALLSVIYGVLRNLPWAPFTTLAP